MDLQVVDPEDLVLLYFIWRTCEVGSTFSVVDSRLIETLKASRKLVPFCDEVEYTTQQVMLTLKFKTQWL